MSQVRSRDGTTIAYDRLGAGRPVILVDGAFCSRSFGPMPKLAPLLARDFTVFMYDRRGRGASGDTAPYAVEREIDDLDALILKAIAPTLVYDSGVMGDFSLPVRRAASLTMPAIVISGDKSMPVLRAAAQELARVIPGARLRTLPGQTHNVAAAALAPVLKEFFAP